MVAVSGVEGLGPMHGPQTIAGMRPMVKPAHVLVRCCVCAIAWPRIRLGSSPGDTTLLARGATES